MHDCIGCGQFQHMSIIIVGDSFSFTIEMKGSSSKTTKKILTKVPDGKKSARLQSASLIS